MASANSGVNTAVLEGAPLDGREHPIEVDTDELIVMMIDGAQHRYVASDRVQALADDRVARIFGYRGRHYPR